jgi:hypothetical protein
VGGWNGVDARSRSIARVGHAANAAAAKLPRRHVLRRTRTRDDRDAAPVIQAHGLQAGGGRADCVAASQAGAPCRQ